MGKSTKASPTTKLSTPVDSILAAGKIPAGGRRSRSTSSKGKKSKSPAPPARRTQSPGPPATPTLPLSTRITRSDSGSSPSPRSRQPPTEPPSPLKIWLVDPTVYTLTSIFSSIKAHPLATVFGALILGLLAFVAWKLKLSPTSISYASTALTAVLLAAPVYPDKYLISPPFVVALAILLGVAKYNGSESDAWLQISYTFLACLSGVALVLRFVFRYLTTLLLVVFVLLVFVGLYFGKQYMNQATDAWNYVNYVFAAWSVLVAFLKFKLSKK